MDNSERQQYKYCLVPCCTNTSVTTREKLFFYVPNDPVKRKLWTRAMKRDENKNKKLSCKSSLYCCEDHFSLEDDMENYWQWHLTKDVKRLKLKAGVVPHRFECQKSAKPSPVERKGALKRKRQSLVKEAISAEPVQCTTSSEFTVDCVSEVSILVPEEKTQDKCIQVNLRKSFRSKYTNTHILKSVACSSPNTPIFKSVACSPLKFNTTAGGESSSLAMLPATSTASLKLTDMKSLPVDVAEYIDSDSEPESVSEFEYEGSVNYRSDEDDLATQRFQQHMLEGTIMSIERKPKLFLGLPPKSFSLIKLLSEHSSLPINHIYIVLKKLRLHNTFSILANDFGVSVSTVCRIFMKSLHVLANVMQELIVWPSPEEIRANLPIPFRARYGKVAAIIDCLEIQIEKPSNPIEQSLTWSNYYSCNTIKYMVSCTPDGLVTFVSEGYGGRTSDLVIFEDSGFADHVTPGTHVMADRGFKHISSHLERIGSQVVRPPTVSAEEKCTKVTVKQSQRIAALRIHVERVIGRLREFKMLTPHASVDYKHVHILDKAMIVACGLINMQDLLFRK